MKIHYDKEADAMYITLREGEFEKNKKIDALTIADYDKQNNLLGIEILQASEYITSSSEVDMTGF